MITDSFIKHTGKVIQFDNEKGFGFIKPDSEEISKPVFLHFSEIMSSAPVLKTIQNDEKIQFEIRDFSAEILQAVKIVFIK